MNAMTRPTILPHPAMIATAPARRWYVLALEPARDYQAMYHLRRQGFDARCLQIKVRVSRLSSERRTELMFPGYAFVEMEDGDERWEALIETNFVCDVLRNMGQPEPLPIEAMKALFALVQAGFDHRGFGLVEMAGRKGQEAPTLPPGTPIKVTDGPFIGYAGKFSARLARTRIEALLTMFGRDVPVALDETQIEVIDDGA